MFGFFGKNEKKGPEERLADCLSRRDWEGLARAYYDLGVAAMDRGELDRAVLWLHRADTVYSARGDVYERVSGKRLFHQGIADDCSRRIGELEEAPLLCNDAPAQAEERAGELNDPQLRVWGMLSLARLVRLGERLSRLPGCQVLGELGWAVDAMCASFQEPMTQEAFQRLMGVCNGLYELGDSEAFFAGGEIEVPGGAPFQVFDLNGMAALLELDGCLDSHLRLLSALSQNQEPPAAETGVITCALLPDYYVRTGAGRPEEVPQLQAELARIWSDCDFVRAGITWDQVARRVEMYKTLDILQL